MKINNKKRVFEKEGQLFNHIKAMYTNSRGYEYYWQNRRKDMIISHLAKLKSEYNSLLDVGCAEGLFVKEAENLGYFAFGCDISRSKISKAKNVKVIECDAQNLPFTDNSFDIVLLNRILELIPDDRKALFEASRVGKNYLIVTVPNKSPHLISKIYRTLCGKRDEKENIKIYEWGLKARAYNFNELKNMLDNYGYVIKQLAIAPFGHIMPFNLVQKIPAIIHIHEFLDNAFEEKSFFKEYGHDIFCLIKLKKKRK